MKKILKKKFVAKIIKKFLYLCQKFCIMRGIFFMLLIMYLIGTSACQLKNKSDNAPFKLDDGSEIVVERKTTINFDDTKHDLGQVNEGKKVVFKYEATNTGNVDLLIHEVRVACGCTTPKFDKKPIPPGKKTTIEVTFDSNRRPGVQNKSVIVIANTEPSNTVLYFTCIVIPK